MADKCALTSSFGNFYAQMAALESASVSDAANHLSPLQTLRERNVVFIPPGAEGFNRLLLEILDCEQPLRAVSVFFKPAECFYPAELLEKIGAHELLKKRAKIARDGLNSGNFTTVEVLNEESVWDLIRTNSQGKFILYPAGVTAEDVETHINHLIGWLERYSGYELILTRAWFPFHLATYDLQSGDSLECFTVFFERLGQAMDSPTTCFAVSDPVVSMRISSKMVERILSDSTTIRDRNCVIAYLNRVREQLVNEGPL